MSDWKYWNWDGNQKGGTCPGLEIGRQRCMMGKKDGQRALLTWSSGLTGKNHCIIPNMWKLFLFELP